MLKYRFYIRQNLKRHENLYIKPMNNNNFIQVIQINFDGKNIKKKYLVSFFLLYEVYFVLMIIHEPGH